MSYLTLSERGKTVKIYYQEKMTRSGHGYRSTLSGPYLYAYWREGGRMRSAYLGKMTKQEFLAQRTAECLAAAGKLPLAAREELNGHADLPGQTTIDQFLDLPPADLSKPNPITKTAEDILASLYLPQNSTREQARKRIFNRTQRPTIGDERRQFLWSTFDCLCALKGWAKRKV